MRYRLNHLLWSVTCVACFLGGFKLAESMYRSEPRRFPAKPKAISDAEARRLFEERNESRQEGV